MSDTNFVYDYTSRIAYSMMHHLGVYIDVAPLVFLEIGCWEGRTTRWLVENILTATGSTLVAIDPYHPDYMFWTGDPEIEDRFLSNLQQVKEKVLYIKDYSQRALRRDTWYTKPDTYDFVYVDGSHYARHCLEDLVLVWPMVKNGGLLCVDDYDWPSGHDDPLTEPRMAIDAFLQCYAGTYTLLELGSWVWLRKVSTGL